MNIVYLADFHAVIWIAITAAAILLLRQFPGGPALLLVIGGFGYSAWQLTESLITHGVISDAAILRHAGIFDTLDYCWRFAVICFPIGFIWHVVRVTPRI